MLSRADVRLVLEWIARAIGIGAMAALFWSLTRHPTPPATEVFQESDLQLALVRWTRERPADTLHLELARAPDPRSRDWLVALRAAGSSMSWRAPSAPALAITTEPVADPRGRVRIAIAAPHAAALAVRDAAGLLDSLTVEHLGGSVGGAAVGVVRADLGIHTATAAATDSTVLRRLLVIGQANWESRFVIAALEEQGWAIDARLVIAPGAVVRQGRDVPIDTSYYSAVIALDTTAAAEGVGIARYVRSGGGLILAGSASLAPALARLAPARAGSRYQASARLASRTTSLATLGYHALEDLSAGAVTLYTGEGGVAVAAHRLGAGRVVQAGHDETWRWRMTGGDEGLPAHRTWWAGLVGAAAYAPVAPTASASTRASVGDGAPLASLFAMLGPPRAAIAPRVNAPVRGTAFESAVFALAVMALLAEWASRRLRGAA